MLDILGDDKVRSLKVVIHWHPSSTTWNDDRSRSLLERILAATVTSRSVTRTLILGAKSSAVHQ
jgi:hypothetical protein